MSYIKQLRSGADAVFGNGNIGNIECTVFVFGGIYEIVARDLRSDILKGLE